jgi:hypothetical protein
MILVGHEDAFGEAKVEKHGGSVSTQIKHDMITMTPSEAMIERRCCLSNHLKTHQH